MPPTKIGRLIKAFRIDAGLTQKELGDMADVSHVAVGDWERGKRNPKRPNVIAIAKGLKGLGFNADELFLAAYDLDDSDEPEEVERISDPSEVKLLREYRAATPPNKQILLGMAEKVNEVGRDYTIGGRSHEEPDER